GQVRSGGGVAFPASVEASGFGGPDLGPFQYPWERGHEACDVPGCAVYVQGAGVVGSGVDLDAVEVGEAEGGLDARGALGGVAGEGDTPVRPAGVLDDELRVSGVARTLAGGSLLFRFPTRVCPALDLFDDASGACALGRAGGWLRWLGTAGVVDVGELGELPADAACTRKRVGQLRPHGAAGFDVRAGAENCDVGVEDAQVGGLLAEPLTRDRALVAHAQVVGGDEIVQSEQPVKGG